MCQIRQVCHCLAENKFFYRKAFCIKQCFSTRRNFVPLPRGHFTISRHIFGFHNWRRGAASIYYIEDRVLNILQCMTVPYNKEWSGPNVNRAEVEKPWLEQYFPEVQSLRAQQILLRTYSPAKWNQTLVRHFPIMNFDPPLSSVPLTTFSLSRWCISPCNGFVFAGQMMKGRMFNHHHHLSNLL